MSENSPLELIEKAFSCLTDTQTLGALSLVSKSIHGLVEPLLYHTYKIDDKVSERTLYPFLCAIISHPQLANHVKRLDIRSLRKPEFLHQGNSSTQQSLEDVTRLVHAIKANTLVKCPDWTRFLAIGKLNESNTISSIRGAYFGLLFSHMHNVELLRFEVREADFNSTWKTLDFALRCQPYSAPRILLSLKRLSEFPELGI